MNILSSLTIITLAGILLSGCCSRSGCNSCDCEGKGKSWTTSNTQDYYQCHQTECKTKCCSPQPHWWNRDCCDPSNYEL